MHDLRLHAAARGDRHARSQLLTEHGPLVWGLCRRLAADPDDAYQDVWVHVFSRLDRYDPDGRAAFRTWLFTVVHHKLLDRVRKRSRRRETDPVDIAHARSGPEAQILARDALDRGLAALTADQRRAVLAVHGAGLPLATLAEQEGVALGTIKSRLHRARVTLAKLLERP